MRFYRYLTALVTFCFFTTALQAASFVLRPEVTVDKEKVLLGDILESVPGKDFSLARLTVGDAPAPGLNRIIPRRLVEMRLKQAHVRDFSIEGAGKVIVSRPAAVVTEEMIKKVVREFMESNRPDDVYNPDYRFSRVPDRLLIEPGEVTFSVKAKSRDVSFRGGNYLEVAIMSNGEVQKRINIGVDVESMVEVVVTSKDLARGTVLTEDDLAYELRRFREIPRTALVDKSELIGKRLRRFMAAKICLTSRDVEIPPVVKRGDRVLISVRTGGIEVSIAGEAREDARLGEEIWVKNIQSGKLVQARVVDAGTVLVDTIR